MSNNQTYIASCHCGRSRVEVDLDPTSEPAMMCNCSICGRTGALMRFVPADKVKVLSSRDPTDYQFGKKHIHHLFCSTCGIRPWAQGAGEDGQTTYAINLRCLENFDPQSVEVSHFDGKSL